MKVGLVNYDSGNLRSVSKALEHEGAQVAMVSGACDLGGVQALVLPGVGAFGDAVASLQRRGLWQPLRTWLTEGRPFLGICLGYQLLFESSEESPGVEGLNILPGRVVRFTEQCGGKIPHMGWNTIEPGAAAGTLWRGLDRQAGGGNSDAPSFYFVHSYYPAPAEDSCVSAWCRYGDERFAAAVESGQLLATQFHPEKSQTNGLKVLKNFLEEVAS